MPTKAEERFREALRTKLEQAARYHTAEAEYAIVVQLNPVQATVATDQDPLTEDDDLLFGHSVRQYDADYGLEVGDTLVVHKMEDGNYAVVDVLHDQNVVQSGAAGGGGGNVLRYGVGPPAAGLGIDGDFYIDDEAETIYGPKTAGGWGAPTSMVGPPGDAGAQGPEGAQGPQGTPGDPGPAGPAGPAGPQGPAGQSFTWGGAWNPATTYHLDDAVRGSDGSSYIALGTTTGNDPVTDGGVHWSLSVIHGAVGPAGPAGPAGPQGPQGAVGPQGAQGVQGVPGAQGAVGPAGPQGIAGPQGPAGPAGVGASRSIVGGSEQILPLDGAYHVAPTPDRIVVTTTVAGQPIAVFFWALWNPNAAGFKAALFIDGVQMQIINSGGNPVNQEIVMGGGNSARIQLATAGNGLRTTGQPATHTNAPAAGVPFVGVDMAPDPEPCIIQGLAAGAHTIEVRYGGPAGGTNRLDVSNRTLAGWPL